MLSGRWFALALAFSLPCAALVPLTPSLTHSAHSELKSRLAAVGLPEVAHSSVEIAVTAVLDFQPGDRSFHYREPYPQLPEVDATAVSPQCATVVANIRLLDIRLLGQPEVRARLFGRYCLVGPAMWESKSQTVQPSP